MKESRKPSHHINHRLFWTETNLLFFSDSCFIFCFTGRRSKKETPTILHFAAKFGLKELCAELLTCPGAAQAFTLENVHGLLPNDIAAAQGHGELEKFLTDYMVRSTQCLHLTSVAFLLANLCIYLL